MAHRPTQLFVALLALALLLPAPPTRAATGSIALADGRFYTETGGGGGQGFAIEDDANGKFWSAFQALGGVDALGFPASTPFQADGFTYQAVQGALLQWRPDMGRAILANTFEQFTSAGLDDILRRQRQIPLPIADDGSGGDYQRAVATRLSWLTDPAIAKHFYANPNAKLLPAWSSADAIQLYGLPMSRPERFGPFVSQRFQRITFQFWTQAVPGMPAPGTVVRVLGGDLAKEEGLVPVDAQRPQTLAPDGEPMTVPDLTPPPVVPTLAPEPPAAPGAAQPPAGPNQFPLAPCRASAIDPRADQNVAGRPAPEAGTYLLYGSTPVKLEHNDDCWSPSQLQQMGNHRAIADIQEVVIHWTDLGYAGSAYALRRGVSVQWLIPRAANPHKPVLELIDPRNAAWHAGPLNKGLWEDPAHMLCVPGEPCKPNGNLHSIGFENEGSTAPNAYQVGVITDIMATLIREGYPIQLDRQHVVGHREINRQKPDPGNLDIDHVIALVKQKLGGWTPPAGPTPPAATPTPAEATPTPPPSATPSPTAGDGSSANPLTLVGTASGRLTGSSGGASVYYTLSSPGGPLTLRFSYSGMAAPAGAVGIVVYQGSTALGTVSPPGGQAGGATVTVTATAEAPLIIQVFSYVPQTVTYELSQG